MKMEVRNKVHDILGEKLMLRRMSKVDPKIAVQNHLHRFVEGHPVREWPAVEGGNHNNIFI